MLGVHIHHTKPFIMRNPGKKYYIEDFHLLSTILSALKWREKNGRIKLYTDTVGYEFYQVNGLLELWDGGIDIESLENHNLDIDFNSFWAGGKLISIANERSPFFMIDTDFICWENILNEIGKSTNTMVIHREEVTEMVYPGKEHLKANKFYTFNEKLDWDTKPCNTAFVYFGNEGFKEYYLNEAFRFMRGEREKSNENVTQMVFAEQRLLSMCASEMAVDIKSFLEMYNLEDQKKFTHIWGYKDRLRKSEKLREEFCLKCIMRIKVDFPEKYYLLENIRSLEKYFR